MLLQQPTHPIKFNDHTITSTPSDEYLDSTFVPTVNNQSTKKIKQVLSELSTEELEHAAQTNYEYIKKHSNNNNNNNSQILSSTTRTFYAARMCQRYLESKNGNVPLALDRIRQTLEFRQAFDVQGLMTAFDDTDNWKENETATMLKHHISHHKFQVQGYDKQGRSTLMFIPRNTQGFDKKWDLKLAVYSMERAIACSKASDGTINAVVDFSGFSVLKQSPPMEIGIAFLTTLRKYYAGQIHKIYMVDCPSTFSMLWKVFSPFVGTKTKQKIEFVSGKTQKKRVFGAAYDVCEVPDWLCPGGTNTAEWDVEEYLHKRAFDQSL